jgi:hypothetical protein
MIDLAPVKDINILDVLGHLGVDVPPNVVGRRHPQIRCPLPGHDERGASVQVEFGSSCVVTAG